jgi:hypothetical protein
VLGLQDIDLCGPDLEYNVEQAARDALLWCNAIKGEPEDGNQMPWITRELNEHNEHTAPIAPRIVRPNVWTRQTKQKQETDDAAATADPMSLDAGASSTGSPIGGFVQPTKKVRTGEQLPAAATADEDVTMGQPPVAVKEESIEDHLFSIIMEKQKLQLEALAIQEPIAVENSPAASDDEGEETAPVNAELADLNERIEEVETNCRSEADNILRNVLDLRRKNPRDVGMAPAPTVIVPWKALVDPDHCARSWIARIRQMGTHHVARHRANVKIYVTDAAALTLNTIAALDALNAQMLSGWAMRLSQLMCKSHTDRLDEYPKPIPNLETMDLVLISDSTCVFKTGKKKPSHRGI